MTNAAYEWTSTPITTASAYQMLIAGYSGCDGWSNDTGGYIYSSTYAYRCCYGPREALVGRPTY